MFVMPEIVIDVRFMLHIANGKLQKNKNEVHSVAVLLQRE
jgi:hypothetical protein